VESATTSLYFSCAQTLGCTQLQVGFAITQPPLPFIVPKPPLNTISKSLMMGEEAKSPFSD